MKEETAKKIYEASQELGYDSKLYENYSGRGMFGKTTTGIVFGSDSHFVKSFALAACNIKDKCEQEEFIEDFSYRSDNMGYNFIYY